MNITGMGKHVNNTVSNKKGFLPKTSLKNPIGGLMTKDRSPYCEEIVLVM